MISPTPQLVFNSFQHMAVDQILFSESPSLTMRSHADGLWTQIDNLPSLHSALDRIFDEKYANYTWYQDARCGVVNWVGQFCGILASRLKERLTDGRFLVIGAGSANEAGQVWSKFGERVTLSETGARLLRNCRAEAPIACVIKGRAEALTGIPSASKDLYCALRVYESVFFDIPRSLAEAARVLSPGGVLIISISNGYLKKDGGVVRGQIGKDGHLDATAPWHKLIEIASMLRPMKFGNLKFYDLQSELVISAVLVA